VGGRLCGLLDGSCDSGWCQNLRAHWLHDVARRLHESCCLFAASRIHPPQLDNVSRPETKLRQCPNNHSHPVYRCPLLGRCAACLPTCPSTQYTRPGRRKVGPSSIRVINPSPYRPFRPHYQILHQPSSRPECIHRFLFTRPFLRKPQSYSGCESATCSVVRSYTPCIPTHQIRSQRVTGLALLVFLIKCSSQIPVPILSGLKSSGITGPSPNARKYKI